MAFSKISKVKTNHVSLLDKVTTGTLVDKENADVIYFDISKAFYKVLHDIFTKNLLTVSLEWHYSKVDSQ